ncbi:MAG: Cysteine desulfuration protein SufE [Hyphomicrobiaceae bacterium hypho_1]
MSIDDVIADFALLDDWEDRYRYIIELGRTLTRLNQSERTDATKIRGCASQVWLVSEKQIINNNTEDPTFTFRGESDAHIVQGLIAILLRIYSGKRASQILEVDAISIFDSLGLNEHLSSQRANGLRSMIARIKKDAAAV